VGILVLIDEFLSDILLKFKFIFICKFIYPITSNC
jgi:hypothetical protein